MSTPNPGTFAPETVNPGTQLMQVYQCLWSAELRLQRLTDPDPHKGLDRLVEEHFLSPESLADADIGVLAQAGEYSLLSYFDVVDLEAVRARALSRKEAAEHELEDMEETLSGKLATIRALPDDSTGTPMFFRCHGDGRRARRRSRYLESVTAPLDYLSLTPGTLEFSPGHPGFLKPAGRYTVWLYNHRTNTARVEIDIQ